MNKYLDMPERGRDLRDWIRRPLVWAPRMLADLSLDRRQQAYMVTYRCDVVIERADRVRERFGMAKAKKREIWQTEWIHLDMSPEQKGAYREWELVTEDVLDLLGGRLAAGYKVSCNFNSQNDTFQASLICLDDKSDNAGLGVSAFAGSILDALRVLCYKVEELLPEDWHDYEPPGGKDIG